MHKNRNLKILILLSAFSILIPSGVSAVTNSYIEAVKLDMKEFETKSWTQPSDSEWFPSSQEFSVGRSDSLAAFNDFLKKRFPSSYFLYKKLDTSYQTQIWQNFSKTGNLGGIRSDIFSFRKQARRNRLK